MCLVVALAERVLTERPFTQAEEILTAALADKEYLPITGLAEFTKAAAKLAYGPDSAPLKEGRVRLISCPEPRAVTS